jgi:hypothetical protein
MDVFRRTASVGSLSMLVDAEERIRLPKAANMNITTAPTPFAASLKDKPGDRLRLAVSRELASVYTDILSQPLPPELRNLIEALEDRYRSRAFPSGPESSDP